MQDLQEVLANKWMLKILHSWTSSHWSENDEVAARFGDSGSFSVADNVVPHHTSLHVPPNARHITVRYGSPEYEGSVEIRLESFSFGPNEIDPTLSTVQNSPEKPSQRLTFIVGRLWAQLRQHKL